MPLGQGIGEMVEAVRDRIELSGEDPVWEVTAGSFESALDYARERFGDPVVVARRDRNRWWPRVTLTVSTDPAAAEEAPPLEELAGPPVPRQRDRRTRTADDGASQRPDAHQADAEPAGVHEMPGPRHVDHEEMPSALAEIFDRQDDRGRGRSGR